MTEQLKHPVGSGHRTEQADGRMTTQDRLEVTWFLGNISDRQEAQLAAQAIDDAWNAGWSKEASIEHARQVTFWFRK